MILCSLAPRQPRVLDSGDKLRLGETTLHFLLGNSESVGSGSGTLAKINLT